MITVGLVKELYFISKALKSPVYVKIRGPMLYDLEVRVENNKLYVAYDEDHIWEETIEGDTSFFGIESCDSISRAMACLESGDPNWKNYTYFEKSS